VSTPAYVASKMLSGIAKPVGSTGRRRKALLNSGTPALSRKRPGDIPRRLHSLVYDLCTSIHKVCVIYLGFFSLVFSDAFHFSLFQFDPKTSTPGRLDGIRKIASDIMEQIEKVKEKEAVNPYDDNNGFLDNKESVERFFLLYKFALAEFRKLAKEIADADDIHYRGKCKNYIYIQII
jgi:hypothetical protein